MRECNDPDVDIADMIFDEEDGGPSERQKKPGSFAWFLHFPLYRTEDLGYNKMSKLKEMRVQDP